jgi:hypothetical protein
MICLCCANGHESLDSWTEKSLNNENNIHIKRKSNSYFSANAPKENIEFLNDNPRRLSNTPKQNAIHTKRSVSRSIFGAADSGAGGRYNREPPIINTENPEETPEYSFHPSAAPSMSRSPSLTPSDTPSSSPSCSIEEDSGSFGNTSSNPIVLDYSYEMETDSTSTGPITDEIVPSLEEAISRLIIRSFQIPCDTTATGSRQLGVNTSLRRGRKELGGSEQSLDSNARILDEFTILGLSSFPADVVNEGKTCGSISNSANACHVLDGRITIYSEGSRDSMELNMMSQIKSGMNDGELLYAHTSIEKITFIQRDTRTIKGGNTTEPNETPSVWTPGYVSAIAIASAIILSSVLCARGVAGFRNKKDGEYDSDFDASNWREESNNSSFNVSSDDETIMKSNKSINVDVTIEEDVYGDLRLKEDMEDLMDDELEVNIDLEAFEPSSEDGDNQNPCFQFFDLIIDDNENQKRRALVDSDQRSHMSELSI